MECSEVSFFICLPDAMGARKRRWITRREQWCRVLYVQRRGRRGDADGACLRANESEEMNLRSEATQDEG